MESLTKSKTRGKILPPPLKLYDDYQVPIVKSMMNTILEGKNGLVIQPTATGKSIESAFVARACILLHNMKGLYLYDENEGLVQAREKCEWIFNKNPITCANFFGYGKDQFVDNVDMVFASFQSLNNHREKWYQMFDPKHFGFIIVNEGHHAQATTYKEVIDYFNCSKIGMTATPQRMDGKDILEIFHQVIAEITLPEAIVKGWVAKVEYHILSHNLSTQKLKKICKDVLEDGMRISIKQLNETIFVESFDEVVFQEIYKHAFPEGEKPRQTLIFCESITHAEHVLSLLKKDGKSAEAYHSQKSNELHNRPVMKRFRENKIQFLVAIDKVNEDIDLPNVEVGVFLRATNSLTVFLQQLGRLLRNQFKKTAIVLDFVANVERLVIVRELMKSIEEALKLNKLPLTRNHFHVSGQGFDIKLTNQIVDILKVLEAINEGFYGTWQEASCASIFLKIKNYRGYKIFYKQDYRLPSSPDGFYSDFPGWSKFLGNHKYETLEESSNAAIILGIKSREQYRKLYKNDSRLPSNPNDFYEDFINWYKFLGKPDARLNQVDKYKTWQEASNATIKLNIKSWDQYKKCYKLDPRLPAHPDEFYSDFPGWKKFGKQESKFCKKWQQASKIAIDLGCKSSSEYKKNYTQSIKLPSNPDRLYKDFPGWDKFLGKK